MTKVWGFSVPCGPLQFSTAGWRDRARSQLLPGDFVVLVGTKDFPTPDEDRGRILGMMEPTTERVMSLDFPLEISPHDRNAEGDYRWPYGLLNRRAWRFIDPPLFEEVSTRQFSMDAALGIVTLTHNEEESILRIAREEIELLRSFRTVTRLEGQEAARRRNAPIPTTTRDGVMHLRRAPAYTYAMEIQGAAKSSFKIGWAFDHQARVRQFNLYALPQLGGVSYGVRLTELWETARWAFAMEQYLLRLFDTKRHPSNREVIHGVGFDELRTAWGKSLMKLRSQS